MNKYQDLLTKTGFVLISDKGIESSGFDFNYDHSLFDGCRMAQLSPLLFAQSKLNETIQSNLIDSQSSDGNECHRPFMTDEKTESGQMGECFGRMLRYQIPYEQGSRDYNDFIEALYKTLINE